MPQTRYVDSVPDTLDLAERASLAINGLTGAVDRDRAYEIYFIVRFCTNPPHMYHDTTGWPTNNPKFAESLPMMRLMSGSEQNTDDERRMIESMVRAIGEDGLYYAVANPDRTWHEGVGHVYFDKAGDVVRRGEDFANVAGNGRMVLAMMAWHERDGDAVWLDRTAKLIGTLTDIAVDRGDYAYYPDPGIGEAFSYPASGWPHTEEPQVEQMGAEGSMFACHGTAIRAISRWAVDSGDGKALECARKLVSFVMQPRFWGVPTSEDPDVGADIGQFVGHRHGHTLTLRALLEYAIAANDATIKRFVRDSYEYTRSLGIARIGLFGEACTTADMIALAIKLTDSGVGDYWEDVDQYVRNMLIEYQVVDGQLLAAVSEASPPHATMTPHATDVRVIERTLGNFAGDYGNPTKLTNTWVMQCCTGNGSQALYYAWDGALRHSNGIVNVNLLLNRASPWVDVHSYLPYEGKVVVRNKTARTLFIRLPRWVDRAAMRIERRDDGPPAYWLAGRLGLDGLTYGETVTLRFPTVQTQERCKYGDDVYRCAFKGNTMVDVSPRDDAVGYPIFMRSHLLGETAPMVQVRRSVTETRIRW